MGRKKSGRVLRTVYRSPREAGDTTGGSEHGSWLSFYAKSANGFDEKYGFFGYQKNQ